MILAAIIIAKNPTLYGFDVGRRGAARLRDGHRARTRSTSKIIAEWAGVTDRAICRSSIPSCGGRRRRWASTTLKVPIGTAATIQATARDGRRRSTVTFQFHTVKRGETLTTIARKYERHGRPSCVTRTTSAARRRVTREPDADDSAAPGDRAAVGARAPTPAPATSRRGATGSDARHLSRPAGRHALQHRAAVRHDRRAIKRLNRLSSDRITIGDQTHRPALDGAAHRQEQSKHEGA